MLKEKFPKIKAEQLLIALILITGIFLLLRNLGLYPSIFADEWNYSRLSRLIPFDRAYRPNYLYYAIFKTTSLCGDSFLECARLYNVVFFILAAPFIYAIAKDYTGQKTSLVIVALSLFGSVNIYTAYFMPESAYYFCFWAFIWAFLKNPRSESTQTWVFLGILLGLGSLIKPHALFLLPPLFIFLVFLKFPKNLTDLQTQIKLYSLFIFSTFFTKFALSYLLAGTAGLTLFGPQYSNIATSSVTGLQRLITVGLLAWDSLIGHLMLLAILFSVPLAHILAKAPSLLTKPSNLKNKDSLALLSLLIFMALVAMVALFTASAHLLNPRTETMNRLHLRYYNFAFPLLFIVLASQLSGAREISKKLRAFVALPIGFALLYGAANRGIPFRASIADNPEFYGIASVPAIFYQACILSFIALIVWVFKEKFGIKAFLFVVSPFIVFFSASNIHSTISKHKKPITYDQAGQFIKFRLPKEAIPRLHVIGYKAKRSRLIHTQFYLDDPKVTVEIIKRRVFDLNKLPKGKDWLLVVGKPVRIKNAQSVERIQFMTLAFAKKRLNIDFSNSKKLGILRKISGLEKAESWGAWSKARKITMHFTTSLPAKFEVTLKAKAFGPNIDQDIVASTKDSKVKFKLHKDAAQVTFYLDNPSRSNKIAFDIPLAIATQDVGAGPETGEIKIGLIDLKIRSYEE
ncbi:MAG: glycosyltransferase family 39 protein [SAR324 cluster bacterium]|nr:glycosyltransferase family 39 protein [SAR324 cluster bacterium]